MIWMLSVAAAQQAEVSNVAWCFTSGLRVLFEEDHSRPEVAVRSLYEGGSSGGEPGLAHLVEHLWFQARPEDEGRVMSRLNAMGARFNAFTSRDQTVFETIVPRRKARAVLVLEASRLDTPLAGVDEGVFSVERNVVKNEISSDRGEEKLYAALFPSTHPYHHGIGGTVEGLGKLTLEQASAYASRWYRPDQMTLHVKGDLTTEQFEKVLVTSFPKDTLVREGTQEVVEECRPREITRDVPESEPAPLLRWEGAVSKRQGRIAWRYDPSDDVMVDFATALLSYRLEDAMDRPVACWALPFRRAGLVECRMTLEPEEDPEKVLRRGIRVSRELWQPNQRLFLDRNYDYWKAGAIGALYRRLEVEHDLAATRFHLSGRQDWLEHELERRSVDDFSEAARIGDRTFTVKGAQLAVVDPRARDRSAGDGFHAVRKLTPAEAADASLDNLERLVAEPNWVSSEHRQLPNGLTVSVFPQGMTDLVRVWLVFPGGARAGGVTDAVAWYALPDQTLDEHEKALALLGRWSNQRTADSWRYTLSGVSVDKQLKLLANHLKNQTPSNASVRAWRREDDVSVGSHWQADLKRLALLDPQGLYEPKDRMEQARNSNPKEIRSWVSGQLAPQGAHLVVMGRVDPQKVLAQARGLFGRMKTTVPPVREPQARERVDAEPIVFHHTDDGAVQSSVVLDCRLDEVSTAASAVTRSLIEDAMFTTLREELGAVYTPGVYLERDGVGERLEVRASVERGRAGEALAAAQQRIRALAGGVSDEALALAKVNAAKVVAGSLDSGWGRMHAFTQRALAGHPGTGGAAASLAAVTGEQVQQTLSTCAGHEVMSAVGPNGPLDAVKGRVESF